MIILEAPIQRVIVYTDRARVIRQGRVRLSGGENAVTIPMLPMTLDDKTVRATSINPTVQIIDVEVVVETLPPTPIPEAESLQAEYDQLVAADQALADDDAIEDGRLTFLRDLRESASTALGRALAGGKLPLENIDQLMDYVSDQQRRSNARRREIAHHRRELSRQMDTLQRNAPNGMTLKPRQTPTEFSTNDDDDDSTTADNNRAPFGRRLFGSNNTPPNPSTDPDDGRDPFAFAARSNKSRSIKLTMFAETDGEYEVSVSYMVSRVSWKPFYDIRVSTENDYAISFLAEIQQSTGEDWLDIPISLSTARPNQDADLPRIRPWVIDAAPPPASGSLLRRIGSPPTNNNSSGSRFGGFSSRRSSPPPSPPSPPRNPFSRSETAANESRPLSVPVQFDQEPAQISGAIPTVTYHVPQTMSLGSGDTPTKAFISNFQLEGHLDMMAIPEQNETAFLCARLKNTTEQMILAGSALIFFGTHYVGKIDLEAIAPRRTFMVQLGEQPQVRVQRQLDKHSSSPGPTDEKRRTEFIYRITVFNDGDTPISLAVYDHIPLARHKDITVLLRAVVPQPSSPHNPDTNIFEWRLNIEPRSQQSITLGFALDHPHDMKIVSKRS